MSEPREDAALEALLRRSPPPAAAEGFRRRLREAFRSGGTVKSASREAVGARTGDTMTQELERRLARTPLAPEAREAFRSDLRRRFLAGEGRAAPAPAGRLVRWFVLAAAAAAIAGVYFLLPRDPAWRVRVEGSGPVRVADTSLGAGDARRIAVEIGSGGRLRTGENTVWLSLEEELEVEVRPGTTLGVTALAALRDDEPMRFELEEGEAFLWLRPGDRGGGAQDDRRGGLAVVTPEVNVRVTGTVLGVLAVETGTCVCVAEGRVSVFDERAGSCEVEAGRSYFVFRGDMAPKLERLGEENHEHAEPLLAFAAGR